MRNQTKQVLRSKPFVAIRVAPNVIKFISVFEISKIIINKDRLELIVLLTTGDKDVVKFSSLEDLEGAFQRLYTAYAGVFLAP